jgi:hypothetical protein
MRLDVIRVTVIPDLVVGDQDLRAAVANDWYELIGSLEQAGGPENSFPKHIASDSPTVRGVRHTGIPESAIATES